MKRSRKWVSGGKEGVSPRPLKPDWLLIDTDAISAFAIFCLVRFAPTDFPFSASIRIHFHEAFFMSQQSYWRIARTEAMHAQVLEIARSEGRSLSNTLKRLIAEALDYRRIANRQTADDEYGQVKGHDQSRREIRSQRMISRADTASNEIQ
jgi:hypothetical protein